MTRSDLAVEAAAGAVAAVVTALLSDLAHQAHRRAPEPSAPNGAPRTMQGKALEFVATYLLFRGVMEATRRLAGR